MKIKLSLILVSLIAGQIFAAQNELQENLLIVVDRGYLCFAGTLEQQEVSLGEEIKQLEEENSIVLDNISALHVARQEKTKRIGQLQAHIQNLQPSGVNTLDNQSKAEYFNLTNWLKNFDSIINDQNQTNFAIDQKITEKKNRLEKIKKAIAASRATSKNSSAIGEDSKKSPMASVAVSQGVQEQKQLPIGQTGQKKPNSGKRKARNQNIDNEEGQ